MYKDFFYKLFMSLLPIGRLWQLGINIQKVINILANEVSKLKEYINEISNESIPYTADDTVEEWLKQYGLKNTGDQKANKNLICIYANAVGGSSIYYLENILAKMYPDIIISFNDIKTKVTLDGELYTKIEQDDLIDFVEKIFPAYIVIVYFIDVKEDYGQYSECNNAICGVSVCNNPQKEITIFDNKKTSIAALMVCGKGRTGNIKKEEANNEV
ncbi:hypothetical protein Q5M87_05005 [Brachyspira innocens]|uniref:DUF2313 domain-containing protein n=1 Tax=Brachyspira innocens TaxID=13264 RepID=A0ABT8YV83_9SPIR|nr:hypothetical protein [Brachyspira innocens]MDO6993364.1 hypothetical protein [Brachyspira innocens]MDO7019405.1 hypothetical protein [Brachyspira innocens]